MVQVLREYIIRTSAKYLISKRGTVWKCGIYGYYVDIEERDEIIGDEIKIGMFVADCGDIVISDGRPFSDIFHMIYASDGGEEYGLYVENGRLKFCDIEYHITDFEEFAFELRTDVLEDMSRLSEQEHILLLIQQKYNSMNEYDRKQMLIDISNKIFNYEQETGTDGMPVEMVMEEFLK